MGLSKHQNHIVLSWFVMKCRSWDRLWPTSNLPWGPHGVQFGPADPGAHSLRPSAPAARCNCLFVGYKLFRLTQRKRDRCGSEISLMHSSFSTRQRITRFSDEPLFAPNRKTKVSVSEPMLAPPITSSLTSSAERRATGQRARFLRPDGAPYAGSESLRVPNWRTSAPVLLQSSDSDTERVNTVPPNSPALHVTPNGVGSKTLKHML